MYFQYKYWFSISFTHLELASSFLKFSVKCIPWKSCFGKKWKCRPTQMFFYAFAVVNAFTFLVGFSMKSTLLVKLFMWTTLLFQEILVDRTVHAAIGRYMACHSSFDKYEKPTLLQDDFSRAMHDFLPVSMREVTKSAPDSGRSGWDDVGGLVDIQKAIKEVFYLLSSRFLI